jgi:hypothetical protein
MSPLCYKALTFTNYPSPALCVTLEDRILAMQK